MDNLTIKLDQDFVMFKNENNSELEELNSLVKRNFERDFIDYPENEQKTNEDETRKLYWKTNVIIMKTVVGRLVCYGEKIIRCIHLYE